MGLRRVVVPVAPQQPGYGGEVRSGGRAQSVRGDLGKRKLQRFENTLASKGCSAL
jgi:hypothetical protein